MHDVVHRCPVALRRSGTPTSPERPTNVPRPSPRRCSRAAIENSLAVAAHLVHASNEERHAARIAAKRLRYVAEFFAPLFPGKRGRTYLKRLAAMQDALGRINDAVTAVSLAAELAGPADDAAGAVRGWVAAQAAAVEPMLAKAWRRFDRARPFWPSP